jgi:hypothetical protein
MNMQCAKWQRTRLGAMPPCFIILGASQGLIVLVSADHQHPFRQLVRAGLLCAPCRRFAECCNTMSPVICACFPRDCSLFVPAGLRTHARWHQRHSCCPCSTATTTFLVPAWCGSLPHHCYASAQLLCGAQPHRASSRCVQSPGRLPSPHLGACHLTLQVRPCLRLHAPARSPFCNTCIRVTL